MDNTHQRFMPRAIVVAAVALGLAGGSYGIATAATGSGATTTPAPSATAPPAAGTRDAQQPWGGRRSDETPLSGDALAKVTQLAQAKVPGGMIVRVETDADGHAAYEAHMTSAAGSPVTVYVDKQFDVVGVESR